jgi:hypothetical protein
MASFIAGCFANVRQVVCSQKQQATPTRESLKETMAMIVTISNLRRQAAFRSNLGKSRSFSLCPISESASALMETSAAADFVAERLRMAKLALDEAYAAERLRLAQLEYDAAYAVSVAASQGQTMDHHGVDWEVVDDAERTQGVPDSAATVKSDASPTVDEAQLPATAAGDFEVLDAAIEGIERLCASSIPDNFDQFNSELTQEQMLQTPLGVDWAAEISADVGMEADKLEEVFQEQRRKSAAATANFGQGLIAAETGMSELEFQAHKRSGIPSNEDIFGHQTPVRGGSAASCSAPYVDYPCGLPPVKYPSRSRENRKERRSHMTQEYCDNYAERRKEKEALMGRRPLNWQDPGIPKPINWIWNNSPGDASAGGSESADGPTAHPGWKEVTRPQIFSMTGADSGDACGIRSGAAETASSKLILVSYHRCLEWDPAVDKEQRTPDGWWPPSISDATLSACHQARESGIDLRVCQAWFEGPYCRHAQVIRADCREAGLRYHATHNADLWRGFPIILRDAGGDTGKAQKALDLGAHCVLDDEWDSIWEAWKVGLRVLPIHQQYEPLQGPWGRSFRSCAEALAFAADHWDELRVNATT